MAKKTRTYSQVEATDELERLGRGGTSAPEFIYDLLRIFAGYGDGQLERLRDGRGNMAKDGTTVLIRNLVAYRPAPVATPDGDCAGLYDAVNAMLADPKIEKRTPRLYIASNGEYVAAYDPKENDWYENRIDLLWKDFEFFTPLAGIEKIRFTGEAEADVRSAELMAKLFDEIRRHNDIRDPQTIHSLNVFMSRLLFCFFAEDTGLFPEGNIFTNTLKTHTREDGADLGEFIDRAFLVMSTAEAEVRAVLPKFYDVFPYVNGGLFREHYPVPALSRRARSLIINCGEYNWREINPDIFGSMIQAVVTPEQRAGLGMHYTSVPNIEKVIRPLFLDALEEEFEAARAEAREKAARKVKGDRASMRLRDLLTRLSQIRFFDPACGSGNFLIIAYKRLRDLEIRIWKTLREYATVLPFPNISLNQFYGIDLDEYACDTARLSLWLAEHQMNVKFEKELFVMPATLPLHDSGHIVCGNACRLDWNTVCTHTPSDEVYIMGNPPYLGSKLQDPAQKEDMQIALSELKDKKGLDYIAAWFWKGAEYIKDTKAKYAFVTTNSISQGEQVAMLWKPIFNLGLEIFFARTSFRWSNNARNNATVTVAVIGVENQSAIPKHLYNSKENTIQTVENINPYLSASENVIVAKTYRVPKGLPKAEFGCMPYDNGNLLMDEFEKNLLVEEYPEATKFVKPIMGSKEFLNDIPRYCLWIDDSQVEEAESIPPIKKRIEATEYFRLFGSKDGAELADRPYQFREHYIIGENSKNKIIIPSVSSERRNYIPMGFVGPDTIISNLAFAIYDAEKWLFALLTSRMHNLWVRTVGGRLKTDYRYSATLCYNTFPFPKLTAEQKAELGRLAQNILNVREENAELTLGVMYNPETMPPDLREAHRRLDVAIERIYRPEPFATDEERLEHLFRLYARMTKSSSHDISQSKR